MHELISVGLGVLTDAFVTDNLINKLSAFSDKKAIENFLQAISAWEIEFEQQNDGTVATSSVFYGCIKYNNVIENVISFVINPSLESEEENTFLDKMHAKIVSRIEAQKGCKLSYEDTTVIHSFLGGIINATKDFLYSRISLSDRGLLYIIIQANAQIRNLNDTIQNTATSADMANMLHNCDQLKEITQTLIQSHELTRQRIEDIVTQLVVAKKAEETTASIREKLQNWNNRQIKNLGDRYLPEINIPVGLERSLDGLSLNSTFVSTFLSKADEFMIELRRMHSAELKPLLEQLSSHISSINFFEMSAETLAAILDILSLMITILNDSEEKTTDANKKYTLLRAINRVSAFQDYLESDEITASVSPFILLTGDGGVGKSHLLAGHIQKQASLGNVNLFLLGQQFNGDDPLSVLPQILGSEKTYQEIFQAFEDIARSQNCRFLICIDALNEGAGVHFWNHTLGGLLDFIKGYLHVGLIVSVRTQYEEQLFDEQSNLALQFLRIEHNGFSKVLPEAVRRYFEFYRVKTNALTTLNTEFTNPLFLRLFCVSHSDSTVGINDLSLPKVYEKYLAHIEKAVSKRCGYNHAIKLVTKIINCLVDERTNQSKAAIRLPVETVLTIVTELCKKWNVLCDVYSALLAEGVLTQGINYYGEEYVYITYERLEDYFVAERIIAAFDTVSLDRFVKEYSWILKRTDLLQFVWIVFAEQKSLELNSLFLNCEDRENYKLRNAFLYSLLWRSDDTITDSTIEYINKEILQYEHSFTQFIDVLFALSTRQNHRLNAVHSYQFFEKRSMPDRDSEFIPAFDELFSNSDSSLNRLLNWGCYHSNHNSVDADTAELVSIILCWLLISPNNLIRDMATKALCSILRAHPGALISVMRRYETIDDPYIMERIYAVAFGCAVNSPVGDSLRELSIYVYNAVFDKDEVYPNILLRTYAKNIIDYAVHCGYLSEQDYQANKVQPPYKSCFPEIPSDVEIKQYSIDTSSPDFKKYHYAKNNILQSMKVEYSRDGKPGGYGDFGRYTFQSYFRAWPELHPMDLKNIAIKRIFDLGYDVEKHGEYDWSVRRSRYSERGERIGKKYQWIAMYELAAKVSDNFPMKVPVDDLGEETIKMYSESYQPNIRNIDPTVLVSPIQNKNSFLHGRYHLPNTTYQDWLEGFNDVFSFQDAVRLCYQGRMFILLEGSYNWWDKKKLGLEPYDLPRRNLWHQIRGYFVKHGDFDELVTCLNGQDFMGRWMPEVSGDYELYNKEYYWSDAYDFFKNPYYGNSEWVSISEFRHNVKFSGKLLLPVRRYCSERKGDTFASEDSAHLSWYKICGDVFKSLNLQYGSDKNSCMYDTDANIVCFDSKELLGEDLGYFIDEEQLRKYLTQNKLHLVWTSLSEKRIIASNSKLADLPPKAIHYSALYKYDSGIIEQVYGKEFVDRLYYR